MSLAQLRPTGRTLRALVAVGIVGILVVLLLAVRGKLDEEEKRATYVMSSLSWKVSEALLESQKLVTQFVAFETGAASREDVIVATELLWSRMDVLQQSEFNSHPGLVEAGRAIQDFIDRNEEAIYDAPDLGAAEVESMRADLAAAAQGLRAIWIRDFLGDRQRIHATATRDIADARTQFERLIMGCVALLAIYMIFEIRGAQKAQVRERALREQALAASEAKSDFLANVSHEIRTPLNGVIGMAQELAETLDNDEQRQMTSVILSSAELLLGTINDVLDISKIESGHLELARTAFDPVERVRLSAALFAPALRDKGLTLDVDPGAVSGARCLGDPVRFSQVVNNLMSNAVKFTASGSVSLRLTDAPSGDQRHSLVSVTVTDTGIGIPAAALASIFHPFSQADTSATRSHGGTGLGLAISRAICRQMGGDIDVTTEMGEGSTFVATFRLPYATPEAGELAGAARSAGAADVAGQAVDVAGQGDTSTPAGASGKATRGDGNCGPGLQEQRHRPDGSWACAGSSTAGAGQPDEDPANPRHVSKAALAGCTAHKAQRSSVSATQPASTPAEAERLAKGAPSGTGGRGPAKDHGGGEAVSVGGPGTREATPENKQGVGNPASAHDAGGRDAVLAGLSADHVAKPAHPGAASVRPAEALRILLVDDSATNRMVMKRLLKSLDPVIDEAVDGHDAVRRAEAQRYDLILMDIQMPGKDGVEATCEIRAREALHPAAMRVPIVAVTANVMAHQIETYLARGMDRVVAKPVRKAEILDVIGKLHEVHTRL